ncbi:MAG TPA: hypothetical protein VHB20_02595 [Verrucomicrobiae bacterium]|jgi:hypothetical protein|nr:hypothetical protein [Verrucomicrobiae bacterium]
MSINRSTLTRGPAYASFNSASFHFSGDSKIELAPVTQEVRAALYGKIDETVSDLLVKCTGTPVTWTSLAVLFPWVSPSIGQRLFGDSDKPLVWASNNGDVLTVANAAVTKMPDLTLGVEKDALGPMEFTGLVANGADPEAAGSYYAIATGQSFTAPTLDVTKLTRQRYTAAWGSLAGFGNFQAQEHWTISHELELAPVKIQGRTVDMTVVSYRCLAKCKPAEPTLANIDAALLIQGTGAKHGRRLSANAADLVITGQNLVSITLKNAALKTAGFVFGGKPLRNGELGWVSSWVSAATPQQGAIFA